MMKLLAGVEEVSEVESKNIKNGKTTRNNYNDKDNDDKENVKEPCLKKVSIILSQKIKIYMYIIISIKK